MINKLTPKEKRKKDREFSKFIHCRDIVCKVCGKTGKLDTAHIISRNVITLRYDPLNAVLLCPSHHKWGINSFHQNPIWFYEWFKNKYGIERIEYLKNQLNATQR